MHKQYYNEMEILKILKYINIDPNYAIDRFQVYLEKYPGDYRAYTFYASTLISLGKIEEANKILNYVEEKINNHSFKNILKKERIDANIIFNKLKILSYQEKYQEAYDLCSNSFDFLRQNNIQITTMFMKYCQRKMGKELKMEAGEKCYLYEQILDYSEERFLEHIKKHEYEFNVEVDEPNNCIFSPDVNIEEILKEIKKYILLDKAIYKGLFQNSYVFKYDENGQVDNRMANYIQLISFHNSDKFITMYPLIQGEKLPYIDLNYLKNDTPKVKKINRIDKFNEKYKKFINN